MNTVSMTSKTKDIQNKVGAIQNFSNTEFIFDLLLAYGKPKSSITRLKQKTAGTYNLSDSPDEIYWKDNLLFKYVDTTSKDDLLVTIDDLSHNKEKLRYNPKFVIVTNWTHLLAVDVRDYSSLDTPIKEIAKHYSFFLAWAGMDKALIKTENDADIKAAEKMANLYDEIIRHNIEKATDETFLHSLNVFFSRLLFCFFAEDTNIFPRNLFTQTIAQHTQEDGGDLADFLTDVFEIMNTGYGKRDQLASYLTAFPYVNGKLFANPTSLPKFSAKARRLLIECGELHWARINPDIFGSMIQAVVHPGDRASAGMHYTSVVNIMKVIEPLFLDSLYVEYEKHKNNDKKLWDLLARIYKIKVFDPACGSGNFLVIAYKELRKLEHLILKKLNKLGLSNLQSQIKLENFYGIEIDDFAHEVAMVSLWLAKHQMNHEFDEMFGTRLKLIPLSDSGSIVADNAATADWQIVCPISDDDEVYLLGNPPYLGSSMQDAQQKQELADNCTEFNNYKNLDYIAIWFIRAARYISGGNAKAAFVSTNSVCQGEQVALLWPHIFKYGIEIEFAHTSFRWSNNAKHNAGVTCIIIGLRSKNNASKYLYTGKHSQLVKNINAYLVDGPNIFLPRRSESISSLPEMVRGSQPTDGGHLIMSDAEKRQLIASYPHSRKYIKRYMGSGDFIKDERRWCLWIEDADLEDASQINPIKQRLDAVKSFREGRTTLSTKEYARYPNRFRQRAYVEADSIIVPRVSSERRHYIPIDFLDKDTIVADSANAIYNPPIYVFGLVSSRLHMVWARVAAGRLKTDLRYSSALVYNNFPVPALSNTQMAAIADHVLEVLSARQNHSEKTLAELYHPDKMPYDLKQAHEGLDDIVERSYRGRPFESDEERLSYLFREYEKISENQKEPR